MPHVLDSGGRWNRRTYVNASESDSVSSSGGRARSLGRSLGRSRSRNRSRSRSRGGVNGEIGHLSSSSSAAASPSSPSSPPQLMSSPTSLSSSSSSSSSSPSPSPSLVAATAASRKKKVTAASNNESSINYNKDVTHDERGGLHTRVPRTAATAAAAAAAAVRISSTWDDVYDRKKKDADAASATTTSTATAMAMAAAEAASTLDALRKELDTEKKMHQVQRKNYEETIRSLRRQRDAAEAESTKERGDVVSLRAIITDLHGRLNEKDQEISMLRLQNAQVENLHKSKNAWGDIKRTEKSVSSKSVTASDNSNGIDANTIENGMETNKSSKELAALVAEKDALLASKDEEIQSLQTSLQQCIEQNSSLIQRVVQMKLHEKSMTTSALTSTGATQWLGWHFSTDGWGWKKEEGERPYDENQRNALQAARQRTFDLERDLAKSKCEVENLRQELENSSERLTLLATARKEEVDELRSEMSRLKFIVAVKEKGMELLKISLKESELKRGSFDFAAIGADEAIRDASCQAQWNTRENNILGTEILLSSSTLSTSTSGDDCKKYEKRLDALRTENETLRSMFASLWDEASELRSRVSKLESEGGGTGDWQWQQQQQQQQRQQQRPPPSQAQAYAEELLRKNRHLERYVERLEHSIRKVMV